VPTYHIEHIKIKIQFDFVVDPKTFNKKEEEKDG